MHTIISFLEGFLSEGQGASDIKIQLLVGVFAALFLALVLCIIISRKFQLYIKPTNSEEYIDLHSENEVA